MPAPILSQQALCQALRVETRGDVHADADLLHHLEAVGSADHDLDVGVDVRVGHHEPRRVGSNLLVLGSRELETPCTVLVGALTLLVAAVGIYGIVAHSVGSRTHEIGVHVALGAPRARVLRLVLGSSLRAIGSGAAFGIVVMSIGAFVASDVLEPILFGVGPLDPLSVGGVVCLLAVIMGAAAYLPARRALGVQPIDALRRV